jgi:hypothetical protein
MKTKCKISMLFLDQNFMPFPMATLAFAGSLILCTGKWLAHFIETALAFNLHFHLKGKPIAPFERAYTFGRGLETSIIKSLRLLCICA